MLKLAVFVEGYTELLFIDALITEIAGASNVNIEHRQIRGGTNVPRRSITLRASSNKDAQKYYIQVIDCGGDSQVKSRILEEHENLTNNGYNKIIGVRDVRPSFTKEEIPKLARGLRTYIRTSLIPVDFILPTMETEAWFLAEHNHFTNISPRITTAIISDNLGFNPEIDDMSLRDEPAKDLDDCYQIGGVEYKKGDVNQTVDALDFSFIYLELADKVPQLKALIDSIDNFLSEEVSS